MNTEIPSIPPLPFTPLVSSHTGITPLFDLIDQSQKNDKDYNNDKKYECGDECSGCDKCFDEKYSIKDEDIPVNSENEPMKKLSKMGRPVPRYVPKNNGIKCPRCKCGNDEIIGPCNQCYVENGIWFCLCDDGSCSKCQKEKWGEYLPDTDSECSDSDECGGCDKCFEKYSGVNDDYIDDSNCITGPEINCLFCRRLYYRDIKDKESFFDSLMCDECKENGRDKLPYVINEKYKDNKKFKNIYEYVNYIFDHTYDVPLHDRPYQIAQHFIDVDENEEMCAYYEFEHYIRHDNIKCIRCNKTTYRNITNVDKLKISLVCDKCRDEMYLDNRLLFEFLEEPVTIKQKYKDPKTYKNKYEYYYTLIDTYVKIHGASQSALEGLVNKISYYYGRLCLHMLVN